MARFRLSGQNEKVIDFYNKRKILIFAERTVIKSCNLFSRFKYEKYTPINNAVYTINTWAQQGAEITYLTTKVDSKHVKKIKAALNKYSFPGCFLYSRSKGQNYSDIIDLTSPDLLIGFDHRRIGGLWLMQIDYVKPELRDEIKSIAIKDLNGIDHLPQSVSDLFNYSNDN